MMKVLMIVPAPEVMGGIASVVNGYREKGITDAEIVYVESYVNGSKIAKLRQALRAYRKFGKILREQSDIDIVHIHSSFGPSFYRKKPFIDMAYRKHIPIINHIHGAEFDDFFVNVSEFKKRLIRKTYAKCSFLVALSNEWKKRLGMIFPQDRIVVIENYAIIPSLEDVNNSSDIVFMGEIGERKGSFDIPAILDTVKNKYPQVVSRISLTMAGNGNADELKELLSDYDVRFPGWVRGSDKDILLRSNGIFLFPSHDEGMPMAILEAMAYGLAVISSDVGGIPTLIEDGVNGFLCHPKDTESFAAKIARLLEDEKMRNEMGRSAREFIIKNYSYEMHVRKLLELYLRTRNENGR